MRKEKKKEYSELIGFRKTLRWRLTLFVFAMMILSGTLAASVYLVILLLFAKSPLVIALTVNPIFLCIVLLAISAMFGAVLSTFFGSIHLRPIKALSQATKEVKKGNFKVRVDQSIVPPDSEMGILIAQFNEMVAELDGIEIFRNDFINNFSHEFKTPIVSICGFAKEMQQEGTTEEQREEYTRIIFEESSRLAHLAASVLELSRLENQQIVTGKAEFYLDEQLRQCILQQAAAWTEKGIDMIPELEEVRYYGNEEILSHVWTNLLSNAVKFTPAGGIVRIRLTADADTVTVEISDTGVGMDEEIQARIFEKFYQGDASHHKSGYGIGLALAHKATVLSGGTISVRSAPGEGSTFTVRLKR